MQGGDFCVMENADSFFDETPREKETARSMATEALSRVFLWVAEGKTIEDCGFRSMVAISTIRKDIYSGATLEALGQQAGRQRQAVWKLKEEFRKAFGL